MTMKAKATATKGIIALCGLALTGLLLVTGCGQPASQDESAGDSLPTAVMYKNPNCGCCTKWAEHLRTNGFDVDVREQAPMAPVKNRLGVPGDMRSCHTAVIGDYVIEGHVPAGDIRRLLAEQPEARGLAVPGMPLGSPGMEAGARRQPYTVWLMQNRGTRAFNRYPAQQ